MDQPVLGTELPDVNKKNKILTFRSRGREREQQVKRIISDGER